MNAAATIINRSSNIGISGGGGDVGMSGSISSSNTNNVKYTKITGMRHPCKIVKRHVHCHQLR
jgi:hypothetical protein